MSLGAQIFVIVLELGPALHLLRLYNICMRDFIRRLLLCMLFVAIPAQGLAVVTMPACHSGSIFVNEVIGHIAELHEDLRTTDYESHNNHSTHNACNLSCPIMSVGQLTYFSNSTSVRSDFLYTSLLHLPPVLAGIERPPRFV